MVCCTNFVRCMQATKQISGFPLPQFSTSQHSLRIWTHDSLMSPGQQSVVATFRFPSFGQNRTPTSHSLMLTSMIVSPTFPEKQLLNQVACFILFVPIVSRVESDVLLSNPGVIFDLVPAVVICPQCRHHAQLHFAVVLDGTFFVRVRGVDLCAISLANALVGEQIGCRTQNPPQLLMCRHCA